MASVGAQLVLRAETFGPFKKQRGQKPANALPKPAPMTPVGGGPGSTGHCRMHWRWRRCLRSQRRHFWWNKPFGRPPSRRNAKLLPTPSRRVIPLAVMVHQSEEGFRLQPLFVRPTASSTSSRSTSIHRRVSRRSRRGRIRVTLFKKTTEEVVFADRLLVKCTLVNVQSTADVGWARTAVRDYAQSRSCRPGAFAWTCSSARMARSSEPPERSIADRRRVVKCWTELFKTE